jgi:indole-3-glycerol phosphate synthase
MTILDRINEYKRLEVDRRKAQSPIESLKDSYGYRLERRSLTDSILNSKDFGIIAEFKRKSPSQDDINLAADCVEVTRGYQAAGAAGISCLTDVNFFGARSNDIDRVRGAVDLPVIRKDFMIDSYQLHEARAMGADAILLKDFSVSISNSIRLAQMLPTSLLKISESGIEDPQTIAKLRREGFRGFLIGTYFMREENPGQACADFIQRVREIENLYDGAIA